MAKARRKSARPKRAGTPGEATRDPVLDAAMRLAAAQGWRGLTLAEIADAAGLTLADLYARYPSRQAILEAIRRAADRAMLAGGAVADGPARDRLFEVLMRRFDALGRWRPGIAAVIEDASRDPIALICGGTGALASMAVALEAAGLDSAGLRGLVRAKALAAVWLPALRVWLSDETGDHAATMATLDKGLRRLDAVARFCQAPFAAGQKTQEAA
jgi:AcrR family transcriptional regulator